MADSMDEDGFEEFVVKTKDLHTHLCRYFAEKLISPRYGLVILMATTTLMTEAIKKVAEDGVDIG